MHKFLRNVKKKFKGQSREINPEDIFLDSANIPEFNRDRFEGRMEKPIGEGTFLAFKIFLALLVISLGGKLLGLQVMKGKVYADQSERNRLERTVLFADRGIIYDRKE